MKILWTDLLTWLLLFVVFIAFIFISLRNMIRFGQQVKHNQEAGIYTDPEFKRRIHPLNLLRISLVGVEILLAVVAIWANELGVAPEIWFPIVVVFILAITIVLHVVDRRWRKLMTKGVE